MTQAQLNAELGPIKSDLQEIDSKIDGHLLHAVKQDQRLEWVIEEVGPVRELQGWRREMEAYGRFIKFTFGASALAVVMQIIDMLDRAR